MNNANFDRLVAEAMDALPANIRRHIANVAIVVEELPDDDVLDLVGLDDPFELLGFYHGVPLTARDHNYGLVAPDKISLYRQSILAVCRDDAEAKRTIHRTLRHEIAHYFGIDDERLEELGAY